jgi:hypothetical protein
MLRILLAGLVTTIVLTPIVAYTYLRFLTRGHGPGLIAVSGGTTEALLLSLVIFSSASAVWYWILA